MPTSWSKFKPRQVKLDRVYTQGTGLRVVHEVVDLPHSHTSHIDKKDESQQDQVVFWWHPKDKLQVERVQLCQQKLRERTF